MRGPLRWLSVAAVALTAVGGAILASHGSPKAAKVEQASASQQTVKPLDTRLAMYPRLIRLAHSGAYNGRVIASANTASAPR